MAPPRARAEADVDLIPRALLLIERDALRARGFARIEVQPTLCPAIWDGEQRMRPAVRTRLLAIAHEFLTRENTPPLALTDVVLTGSLANYNWSSQSDLDTHLMASFAPDEAGRLTQQVYTLLAATWNQEHNVTVEGFEVELYVENDTKPFTHDAGVYSLERDAWVHRPERMAERAIDWETVFKKASRVVDHVDRLERLIEQKRFADAEQLGHAIRARLKKHRQAGLERGGEASTENLVFKILRRHGDLNRLRNLRTRASDSALSLA